MTTLRIAPAASEKILEIRVLTLSLAASRTRLLPAKLRAAHETESGGLLFVPGRSFSQFPGKLEHA